ncbi:hypothetical protein ACIP10_36635 [Streptomyces galbus]|uniref:hypothetical protein n=1 Tax=Streptomyces galbus TaxID=33898 RepID=UPI00382EF87F
MQQSERRLVQPPPDHGQEEILVSGRQRPVQTFFDLGGGVLDVGRAVDHPDAGDEGQPRSVAEVEELRAGRFGLLRLERAGNVRRRSASVSLRLCGRSAATAVASAAVSVITRASAGPAGSAGEAYLR